MTLRLLIFMAAIGIASAVQALELQRSSPAADAVLDAPLKGIQLWFDQRPDAVTARVELSGPGGVTPVKGLHAMGDNNLMAMVSAAMPDGDYTLHWTVGDAQGAVPFSIQTPPDYREDRWEPPLDIGIVLYPGAEPLDVFGPLEMWMNAGVDNVRIHLIAENAGPVVLTTTSYPKELAPRVEAQYGFANAPDLDVLMVPGGVGTLVEVDNPEMLAFLRKTAQNVAVATSVCTGSALYARAGLLEGVEATGNKVFFDYLVAQGPAEWRSEARWVESGRFFTSSGVSAGIDMSLAVLARFFGIDAARMIAASTEYEWNEDPSRDPFTAQLNSGVPYVDALRQRFLGADAAKAASPEQ